MITIFAGIVFASLAVYLWHVHIFTKSLSKPVKPGISQTPFISVVVAARNEAHNLPFLLTALANQDYPEDKFEVIIADDESEDQTAAIVLRFANTFKQFKLIRVHNRATAISPKKNALTQAINQAKGQLLAFTDADCRPARGWLKAITARFGLGADVVVGYSATRCPYNSKSLVQRFEHFDTAALFIANAGAVMAGMPMSSTGQNFAYRASAWHNVGGFEKIKHLISGDDVNLLALFKQAGYNIDYCLNPNGFVQTGPISGWKQFMNQRNRWVSNWRWQLELNPRFFMYLLATALTYAGGLALLILKPWAGLLIFFFKFIYEFRFLQRFLPMFGHGQKWIRFFPIWFIIQPFYAVVAAGGGLAGLFRWKKEAQKV